MSHDPERRTAKRIEYAYALPDAGVRAARVRDISTTGAAFDNADAPPTGALIRLQLVLHRIPIEVEAQVVRFVGYKRFAVKFIDLTPGQAALLTDFLGDAVVTRIQSEAVCSPR